jgi:hypothetical protein
MFDKAKLYSTFYRHGLNLWPCIRRTGGRVVVLSPDFRHLVVRLKLNWSTRNVVGTIFGGSMYASTDPFYMLMLMQVLGTKYVVWDKGCTIRFKKPAKKTLFAEFKITDEMLQSVLEIVARDGRTNFTWTVQYKDQDGVVYAEFDKLMYVATKEYYKNRSSQPES